MMHIELGSRCAAQNTTEVNVYMATKIWIMWNQNCWVSKLSVLKYMTSYSTVKPHPPVVTAESSQAGDPWPAGRVRGGEERLPGNNPASGEGGSVTEQPAGAHGAPGAPWLQLQQPGPLEERSCLGRRQRQLEAARCDGAENNTAFRFNVWRGYIEKSLSIFSSDVVCETVKPVCVLQIFSHKYYPVFFLSHSCGSETFSW